MPQDIKYLLEKLNAGTCSNEEMKLLHNYFNNGQNDLEMELRKEWDRTTSTNVSAHRQQELLKRIKQQIRAEKKTLFNPQEILKYAAVFIGLLVISFWYFNSRTDNFVNNEITLELEDGSIKTLETNEALVEETGVIFKEGKFYARPASKSTDAEELKYNTIRVPYGRSVSLVLSDNSEITINAGSSVRYPRQFIPGKPRDIFLDGEAYFEVTHNPDDTFRVISQHTTTEVLGTKFNVSAYPDNEQENIVLLEGSVGVATNGSGDQNILEPNEIAILRKGDESISIEEVNAYDYIAWTRGIMLFRNEKFIDIIAKLERHYDVRIVYEDKELLEKRFTGRFVNESIEDVLKTFQKATNFNYSVDKNKITINPQN